MKSEVRKYKDRQKKHHKETNPSRLLALHYEVLTPEQIRRVKTVLTIRQEGRCAICGIARQDMKREFALDHDHINGHIRGLLFSSCNLMLGCARDSLAVLSAGIRYLDGCNNQKFV